MVFILYKKEKRILIFQVIFPGISINEQLDVVNRFKEGTHLCIVATSVGCEGLDIQQCNLMIRYRFHADEISSLQMRGNLLHVIYDLDSC